MPYCILAKQSKHFQCYFKRTCTFHNYNYMIHFAGASLTMLSSGTPWSVDCWYNYIWWIPFPIPSFSIYAITNPPIHQHTHAQVLFRPYFLVEPRQQNHVQRCHQLYEQCSITVHVQTIQDCEDTASQDIAY